MPRVAGCDPGTSSLDVLVLDGGTVAAQARFEPPALRADPSLPVRWLRERGPFDLVAAPSGYGLPLVRAADCTDAQLELLSLVRPDERGTAKGVGGFTAVARAFRDSDLPAVFLPGVIHLPTVPAHRKLNRIDLGTPDKLCAAALAVAGERPGLPRPSGATCVLEVGSAFTACLVVDDSGEVIDGVGGTSGPVGWRSGGAWDGEVAYLLSPLRKADLFAGGAGDLGEPTATVRASFEATAKAVFGLCLLYDCRRIVASGSEANWSVGIATTCAGRLDCEWAAVEPLPGAWVKHAAQGAAIIADGLAGGRFAPAVERLRLREATGTVLDWITHPRADEVRRAFGVGRPG